VKTPSEHNLALQTAVDEVAIHWHLIAVSVVVAAAQIAGTL
jgi:hypothetical protein